MPSPVYHSKCLCSHLFRLTQSMSFPSQARWDPQFLLCWWGEMIDELPLLCNEQFCVKMISTAEVDEFFRPFVLPKKKFKKKIQVNKSYPEVIPLKIETKPWTLQLEWNLSGPNERILSDLILACFGIDENSVLTSGHSYNFPVFPANSLPSSALQIFNIL